jgi:hypothetical protein
MMFFKAVFQLCFSAMFFDTIFQHCFSMPFFNIVFHCRFSMLFFNAVLIAVFQHCFSTVLSDYQRVEQLSKVEPLGGRTQSDPLATMLDLYP